MQMTSRYRLRWWLVYWWLVGCVLVNAFALARGPLNMITIFVIIQIVPFLFGGIFILWIILLFVGKTNLGIWLTRRQYVLCLLMLSLLGLSPTLFVYSSAIWVAEQTLQTIEVRYGIKLNTLEEIGWDNDVEWGPGIRRTWRVWTTVKTDSPQQVMMQLASDLEKHGWEGGAVTETHYGFQCSNLTAPRHPVLGLIFGNINNVFHVSLPEDEGLETVDEVEIYFSYDVVSPFSSQCRL